MAGQNRFSLRSSQIAQLKCVSSDLIISRRGNKSRCDLQVAGDQVLLCPPPAARRPPAAPILMQMEETGSDKRRLIVAITDFYLSACAGRDSLVSSPVVQSDSPTPHQQGEACQLNCGIF
jgi:hypothetical protein